MTHTPTIRNAVVLAIFFVVQFFWFTAAFTYSESRTVRSDVERSLRVTVPAVPEVADVPAVRDLPKSTATIPSSVSNSAFDIARSTLELANPGKSKSAKSGFEGDLGAQIKYCIVFPLLNSVGPPIPTFDVPVCPGGSAPTENPRLTVVKVVLNDDDGTATTTDFALFVNSTRISSGATMSLPPGSHVVSEATTTVTVGTTTVQYVQSFSGDCDAAGNVTLGVGDNKICTITNDDEGPGGQGGEGNGGDGDGGGGDGDGGGGDGDGGGGGGGGGGGRSGRVQGASTPEFMGGADGVPGIPNTGEGGEAGGTLGLLVFSFTPTFFGLIYFSTAFWRSRSRFNSWF